MIWLNPWAWLGLAAIAVPVAAHLIGRRRPRLVPFPALRFIPETALAVRPRRRIHDLWLLALRVAIVVAAVAALAGPLLLAGDRRGSLTPVARAIVVDTSASMSRPTPGGRLAIDDARERAGRLAAEARQSRLVETSSLPAGIAGATGWLALQSGRREIVVISDFQSGALDGFDVARVPAEYGVRVERVDVTPDGRASAGAIRVNDATIDVTLGVDRAQTAVTWTRRAASDARLPLEIDATVPAPGGSWTAIEAAAAAGGLPAAAPARKVAVTTAAPEASTAPNAAIHDATPWMFDVIEAANRVLVDDDRSRVRFAMPSSDRLVAIVDPSIDALTAVRVVRALAHAAVDATPLAELESATVPELEAQAWTREPGPAAGAPPGTDDSDARWVWALVLVLLGVETLVRRRTPDAQSSRATPAPDDRGHDARVA